MQPDLPQRFEETTVILNEEYWGVIKTTIIQIQSGGMLHFQLIVLCSIVMQYYLCW